MRATLLLTLAASVEVSFTLGPRHLRMLDIDRRWVVEPGVFRRLRGQIVISPGTARRPTGR